MIAVIKKQFKTQYRDWLLMLAFEVGAFLIGMIMFSVMIMVCLSDLIPSQIDT